MKRSKIVLIKDEIKILQNRIKNYRDIIQEHEDEANKYHKTVISMQKRLRKLRIQLNSLIEKRKIR